MKKILILYCTLLFGFFLSAQTPSLTGLFVNQEGHVTIKWNNVQNADSGSLYYRDQNSESFSNIHSFHTPNGTFTHTEAGANYKKTWYFVVNYVGFDTLYSDTIQTLFLQAEALNESCIQLSWNLPFEESYMLVRKYQGETDKMFRIYNETTRIDTVNHCINDYTYLIYSDSGMQVSNETVPLTDEIQPIAPHIDSVSILNNRHVIIGWQRSVSEDCAGYRLYKKQETGIGWDLLQEINHPDTLFAIDSSFEHVCDSERVYCVVAFDHCGNSTPINEAQQLHNLVCFLPTLDTCNAIIKLSWLPLGMYDLSPQLGGYQVLYSKDGDPFQIDGIAPPNTTSYTFDHPERNSSYKFILRAINNLQTSSASSCEHELFAALPQKPQFGFIRYASVRNNYIDICIEVDTQASSPTYEILKSFTGAEGSFQTIKTLQPTGSNFLCITDSVVNVKKHSYHYQLNTLDSCSHILEAPTTVQSILLNTTTNTESQIQLHWTEYEGFINGIEKYDVYRSTDNHLFTKISETFEPTFIDANRDSENYMETFFYQVAAISNDINPDTAWSNISQYLLKSFTVFFPNAFRPNGTVNNIFRPIFSGIEVEEYQLIIYNRWGSPIFSTTTPNDGWNGKTEQGKNCDAGTYIYQFLMSDKAGNRYHNTGFVVLVL